MNMFHVDRDAQMTNLNGQYPENLGTQGLAALEQLSTRHRVPPKEALSAEPIS
jgi:hypothetical protein